MKIDYRTNFIAAALTLPMLCSALVVGDFEGADNLDGWEPSGGERSNVTLSTVSIGATVGSQSLRVANTSTDNSWGAITKSIGGDAEVMSALITPGATITMDVLARPWEVAGPSLSLRLLVSGDNPGGASNEQMEPREVTVDNTTHSMTFELTESARALLANSRSWASLGFSEVSSNTRTWYVDNIQVITPPRPPGSAGASHYAEWLTTYPALINADLESNLYAYAIGADPTKPLTTGYPPERRCVNDCEDIDFIVYQRSDAEARGLVYTVETTDDLSAGNWTDQGYTEIETVAVDAAFNAVTYRLSTADPHRFFRLKVEALFEEGEVIEEGLDDFGGLRSLAFDIPNNGFFRTIFHDDRWLMVTPQNHAYVSFGLNHFHYIYWRRQAGRADFNLNYWEERFEANYRQSPNAWNNAFYDHIKDMSDMVGANSLGYHNEDYSDLQDTRPQLFPYFRLFLPVQFSSWMNPQRRDYPDIFAEAFANLCANLAAEQVAPYANDPMIVGWCLADLPYVTEKHALDFNRPTWAMVLRNLGRRNGAVPAGKQAYMDFIQDRYSNDFGAFDQVYNVRPQINTWNALRNAANWRPNSVKSNSAEIADQNAFNRLCLDKYYEVVKAAIRGAGANQLFMGDKIQANISYEDELKLMVEEASKHVEVLMYQFFGDNIDPQNYQLNRQNSMADWTVDPQTRPNGLPMINGDAGFGFQDINVNDPQWPVAIDHTQRAEWFYKFAYNTFFNRNNVGLHICGVIDSYNSSGTDKPGLMTPTGELYLDEINALYEVSQELYRMKGVE